MFNDVLELSDIAQFSCFVFGRCFADCSVRRRLKSSQKGSKRHPNTHQSASMAPQWSPPIIQNHRCVDTSMYRCTDVGLWLPAQCVPPHAATRRFRAPRARRSDHDMPRHRMPRHHMHARSRLRSRRDVYMLPAQAHMHMMTWHAMAWHVVTWHVMT